MDNIFDRIGGAEKVRELVDRFYDHMDELPEAWEIRKMHADSLDESRDKLYKFLSGWMGGPQLYIEEYGHPRLRARHLPFPVGIRERDQWLLCMEHALNDMSLDEKLHKELTYAFKQTANHMRNQQEEDPNAGEVLNVIPS